MELGVNIKYFSGKIGMEKAARIISENGIKLLDYSPKADDDWKTETTEAMRIFDKYGLYAYQGHAPFFRYAKLPVEVCKKRVDESLEAAIMLGSKYLVVHGDEFDFDKLEYTSEKAAEYNYEYFAPIVEKAIKNNIKIAIENVFPDMGIPRNCSKIEEIAALMDKFNADEVCCCWDFGHGAVSYKEEQAQAICSITNRIECTHVHDNYLNSDSHLIPGLGKIDWVECIKALKSGKKTEVLSFELVYGNISEQATESAVKFLSETGKYLMSIE